MIKPINDTGSLAVNPQSLDTLRLQARQSPDKAITQAAKQFESVFMSMMLKSMRDATPQDGLFDSEQTKTFTAMLDQQLAQNMSAKGVGLADIMVRQLSGHVATPVTASKPPGGTSAVVPSAYSSGYQQDFVRRMTPAAIKASNMSGLPAQLILGQAALESGWGRREIKLPDGSNSYNLFGIKAGRNWKGKVAEVVTTEYVNGVPHQKVARFRAYDSYAQAFNDYARLLSSNPRYADVLQQDNAKGFAYALQQAGYATDPRYADKLAQVISQVSTLV